MEDGEDFIGAFFEGGEGYTADGFVDGAFDGGGDVFELFVDLVAGPLGGAARANEFSGEEWRGRFYRRGQTGCRCGSERCASDDGKFVVFEEVNFKPVGTG